MHLGELAAKLYAAHHRLNVERYFFTENDEMRRRWIRVARLVRELQASGEIIRNIEDRPCSACGGTGRERDRS